MKELLKILFVIIWILGGGMIIASVALGIPLMFLLLGIWEVLVKIPQIILVLILLVVLIYGFTVKVNNPLL